MLFSYLRVTIHAQGQAPPTDTQIVTRGKFYTASVSDLLNLKDINKNKDIGSSRQSSHERPMCGGLSAKPTEVKNLFTISKTKDNIRRPLAKIPD